MNQEPKKKKSKSVETTMTKKRKKTKSTPSREPTGQQNPKKKSDHNDNIKYGVIICLLAFIFVVAGYYYFRDDNNDNETAVVAGDFLPDGKDAKDMSEDDLKKYAQKAADASEFNMVIAPEGTLNLAEKTGKVRIQNPNSNSYPISVDLIDDQTSQVIYRSGSIQPGQEVTDIEVEPGVDLTEGSVATTAVFSIYDPVSKSKQGEVNAGVTLEVTK